MIDVLILSTILGAISYRVGRFIVLDTMIEGTRDKFVGWLEARSEKLFYLKLLELTGCPFCITVWIAGFATIITYFAVEDFAMPVWVWLTSSTMALVFWRIVDSE